MFGTGLTALPLFTAPVATKPAVTLPKERARFDKAMPPNFGDIDLKDFLP